MRPLYDLAVMAIKWAAQVLGASTNTAALLIADRVGYNVLVGITGARRNRHFWVPRLFNVLQVAAMINTALTASPFDPFSCQCIRLP